MEKQQPCYLCLTLSIALTIGMIVASVRFGQWVLGMGKRSIDTRSAW